MSRVKVLDCTLRDGGYCNRWRFGRKNIPLILNALSAANVDYLECGFLTNRVGYDQDVTKYTEISQISPILSDLKIIKPSLLMVNYGEYDVNMLPCADETNIYGLRIAFHKKDMEGAIAFCRGIKEKGYKVFVQPMVAMSYSQNEYIELIKKVNSLKPYAFYIVDSFGMMKKHDLIEFLDICEKNLEDKIVLGFHSHNNLQLAYSNAQYLVDSHIDRELIIDVSIHGMGRGAGNLNSELFLDYLNEAIGSKYSIRPLLNIMDEVICRFYEEKPWGYSLPNYLSATHMIHPNYAEYLDAKKTLPLEAIDDIFSMVDPDKGKQYDEAYIEELYIRYLSRTKRKNKHLEEISDKVKGRKVLIISPGKNALTERAKIEKFVRDEKPIVFSVNHNYPCIDVDYIFVSNMRRFKQLNSNVYEKTITTSNIVTEDSYASVEYYSLLNNVEGVRDNAGLMAINFLARFGVTKFYLAGFDGYSHDVYNNFETREMALLNSTDFLDRMNEAMKQAFKIFAEKYEFCFLTDSLLSLSE